MIKSLYRSILAALANVLPAGQTELSPADEPHRISVKSGKHRNSGFVAAKHRNSGFVAAKSSFKQNQRKQLKAAAKRRRK